MKDNEMKFIAFVVMAIGILCIGTYFSINKIKNDTSIAEDTKRIADNLDKDAVYRQMDCTLMRAEVYSTITNKQIRTPFSLNCTEKQP